MNELCFDRHNTSAIQSREKIQKTYEAWEEVAREFNEKEFNGIIEKVKVLLKETVKP